jgi:uncharacterized protein YjiS (DUF1127 family)
MAHYHDLAHCDYFPMLPIDRLLAVGWLELGFEHQRGDPGAAVYAALKKLLEDPWQPVGFLGGQSCHFCRYDGFYSYRNVFIPGVNATYVAPQGILHYIAVHGYCPPAEFCDAVLACPEMASSGYFEALRSSGWQEEFAQPVQRAAHWRSQRRTMQVLKALGNVLVAQIEQHREMTGRLPWSLAELEDPSQRGGTWSYEVVGEGYSLSLAPTNSNGIELRWMSRSPEFWQWRDGNETTVL